MYDVIVVLFAGGGSSSGGSSSGCTDNDANCGYWASTGECTEHAAYMNLNCKQSCGTCGRCRHYVVHTHKHTVHTVTERRMRTGTLTHMPLLTRARTHTHTYTHTVLLILSMNSCSQNCQNIDIRTRITKHEKY